MDPSGLSEEEHHLHRTTIDFDLLRSIPQQPQVQTSLQDQLDALQLLAKRFGLYDADDFLNRLQRTGRPSPAPR